MDKEPGKQSQAFAREQRKWGGTGGWQYPKAEVRMELWQGWKRVKGRRLGTGSEGNCITHQNSGAIYKDGEGGSVGLTAWVQVPEWRRLPTPQSHPLTSCRHPDVSQSPPTITLPLHRKSTAGTRFKMDQMLTEGELGSPALVGELFGGEGSITCSLELEVQVLNKY